MGIKQDEKEDVKAIPDDTDARCSGYRRPPGTKVKKAEAPDSMITAIQGMVQRLLGVSVQHQGKHTSAAGAITKAVEKRRARNKVARRSRRKNRLYA